MVLATALIVFVLRHDAAPIVQLVFQFEQTLSFFFFEPGKRNAGHLADDLGDHFLVHHAVHFLGLLAPLPLHLFLLGAKGLGIVAKTRSLLVLGILDGFVLLNAEPFDLLFQFRQIRRLGHAAQADARARFVQHVDRLIRKASAGDVTIRHLDGGFESRIEDLNPR